MAAIEARTPSGSYVKTIVEVCVTEALTFELREQQVQQRADSQTIEGKRKRTLGGDSLSTTRVRKQLRRDKSPSPSPSRPRPKTLTPLTARKSVLSPRPTSTLKKFCRTGPLSGKLTDDATVDASTPKPMRTSQREVKAESIPSIDSAGVVVDVDPFVIRTEAVPASRVDIDAALHREDGSILATVAPIDGFSGVTATKDSDAFASATPHTSSDTIELMERSKLTLALSLQRARTQHDEALKAIAKLHTGANATTEALTAITGERDDLSAQLEAKTNDLEATRTDLATVRQELRSAERSLRSAQDEAETLIGRLSRRSSRIAAVEQELAALHTHMHEARMEIGRLVGELRRRDEEIVLARSELARRDEQLGRHTQQIADLRHHMDVREQALRDAVRAIKKRDRDLGTAGCDVQSLRMALQTRDEELARDKRRIGELERGMREMEEAVWLLRQQAAAGKGV